MLLNIIITNGGRVIELKREIRGFVTGILFSIIVFVGAVATAESLRQIDVSFNTIKLQINGQPVVADNILYNSTTYIPLRVTAELLDKEVLWDGETFTANIQDKEYKTELVDVKGNNELVLKDRTGKELYSFKINKITTMNDRYRYAHKEPVQVVLIDFSYTNINNPTELYLSDMNFKVVDSAGKIGYTYPNLAVSYPERIPAGVTCDGQMIFGIDNASDKLKFYFYEDRFAEAIVSFELPIE